ncbi:MAG TPA: hypothetical protein VKA67_12220 [Verrucomicrobiae bacterium]|nr:hypothetical protein [Verrucomicrobiae bacterium]
MSSIAIVELITVAAGTTATYRNVKRARGPRERIFAIWAKIACWIIVSAFLLSIRFIPKSFLVWYSGISVVMLIAGVSWWNKQQIHIRAEESPAALLNASGDRGLTQLSSLALVLLVIGLAMIIVSASQEDPIPHKAFQRILEIAIICLLGSGVSFFLYHMRAK